MKNIDINILITELIRKDYVVITSILCPTLINA